jgi:hypothetical protein
MHMATPNRRGHKETLNRQGAEHNDDTGVVHDSHGGECLDVEGLLHRVCA